MYIRFHGIYSSPKTGQPYGIFVVIFHLHQDGKLSEEDSSRYLETKMWFEEHLPNPPYYEDNNSIKAVTWFKDCIHEPPGVIVYEDDYQVGVTQQL